MKNILTLLCVFALISCKENKTVKLEVEKQSETTKPSIQIKELKTAILAGGKLFRVDRFPSKYITPRSVDIWLPENYSEDKKYSVLYMHDGQNLFDANTTWNKQEWKVDETITDLRARDSIKNVIVVGIHSVTDSRWQDLFPEKTMGYLSEEYKKGKGKIELYGDNYLKHIVREIKPFIDETYATKPDFKNTFIAGSSMGGLMSMYAICEYPKVFSAAICMSTHWPGIGSKDGDSVANAIFSYLETHIPNPENHKMYFDFGTKTLDKHYPQYENRVNAIFSKKGYTEYNFKNLMFQGADHSEQSWQKRFHIPITFLLKK